MKTTIMNRESLIKLRGEKARFFSKYNDGVLSPISIAPSI